MMKYLNSKQAGLKREINCASYKVNLLKSNTIKSLHERIDEQIPNQFIWCEEEKETYFYNEKRQLFKFKFEPIMKKNTKQTTEEYLESLDEAYLKKEIEALAVPWNKFCYITKWSDMCYDTTVLGHLLVDLLYTVKLEKIEIQCGIGIMSILDGYAKYDFIKKFIQIGNCIIRVKQNLNIGKFDLVYNDILLIGESIEEPVKEAVKKECEVSKALKNLNETLDSCIDYLKPKKTNKKSFWEKLKNWF
jgi:hypothetical protein